MAPASLHDGPRLIVRFISAGLFRRVRLASFSGLCGASPRLEAEDCPLELPVVWQVFAERDEACGCERLRLKTFKEVFDDARPQIGEAHVRR